jgi:hypothetical protein
VTRRVYPDGSVPSDPIVDALDSERAEQSSPAPMALGVVMAVHTTDAEVLRFGHGVEVDLILYGPQGRPVFNVPVRQVGGARNTSLWEPNPTTRNLRTNEPVSWDAMMQGDSPVPFDNLQDLDGDHVIVEYIGGSIHAPVVTGAMPHPRATNKVRQATANMPDSGALPTAPDSPARYLSHQGTRMLVDRQGNLVVDTTGAGTDNAGQAITGAGAMGHVALNLKASARLQVLIDGAEWFTVVNGKVYAGTGPRLPAARKTDPVQVGGDDDAAFVTWMANVHAICSAINAGLIPKLPLAPDPPTTIDGQITDGSSKVEAG